MPVPGIGWRLYLSCATPDSKHWWLDSLTAPTVEGLAQGHRRVVLPGDEHTAVKDLVITLGDGSGGRDTGGWHLWLRCHPLDETAPRTR